MKICAPFKIVPGRRRAAVACLMLSVAVLTMLAACGDRKSLPGHVLEPEPAAEFRLADQDGTPVTLAQFRGRPVILTFFYTDCPDVCPVTAQRIGQALHHLGKDASRVAVVAVSVDPDGDTPAKAAAFLKRHGLTGEGRHYLIGEGELLAPIWLAYGVGSTPTATTQRQPGEPTPFGRIGHTDATFLIDRDGRKRTLLRGDATADDYARGLRILLR